MALYCLSSPITWNNFPRGGMAIKEKVISYASVQGLCRQGTPRIAAIRLLVGIAQRPHLGQWPDRADLGNFMRWQSIPITKDWSVWRQRQGRNSRPPHIRAALAIRSAHIGHAIHVVRRPRCGILEIRSFTETLKARANENLGKSQLAVRRGNA